MKEAVFWSGRFGMIPPAGLVVVFHLHVHRSFPELAQLCVTPSSKLGRGGGFGGGGVVRSHACEVITG